MLHPWRHSFVRDLRALDEALLGAKLAPCPHCRRTGMLIGHGMLWGYAERAGEFVVRGRRFVCSKRGRRMGCGRTFSVRLSNVIARFTVRTCTLSRMMTAVVKGTCIKAFWECERPFGLCLRSAYRLWHRLLAAQPLLRTALHSKVPRPPTDDSRPFAQLLAHLHSVFDTSDCVLGAFQHDSQRGLFG